MAEPDQARAEEVRADATKPEAVEAEGRSLQTTDDISTRAAKANTPEEVLKLTQEFLDRPTRDNAQAPSAEKSDEEPEGKPKEKDEATEETAGDTAAAEGESTEAKAKEGAEKEGEAEKPKEKDGDDADEDEEAEAEESKMKRWRLKLSEEDKVGALALTIKKRNADLTLEESIARAREQLGVKDPKNGEGKEESGEPPASDKPATIEETTAKIAKLREERRKAQSEDLDFQKAAQLEAEIESLLDHKFELREKQREQKEQEARQKAEAESKAAKEYDAQFEQSKAQAEALYDFVTKPDTPEAKRAMEIDAAMEKSKDPTFFDPNKPLIIAQMVAREFRIAPKTPGAKKAAAKPVETKPVVASGASRTTQGSTQTGQQLEQIQSLKSPADLERYLRAGGANIL